MVGFLNAHGTNPNIFGGQFLDLDLAGFDADDSRENRGWVSIDELTNLNNEDIVAEESFDHNFEDIFFDNQFLGINHDNSPRLSEYELRSIENWVHARYGPVIEMLEAANNPSQPSALVDEDDFYEELSAPSNRYKMNWWDRGLPANYQKRNYGRKLAKFKIEGKRSRKDKRDHRFGNRQRFANLRDYWSDTFDELVVLCREWNPPSITTFGVEVVGMTDKEAFLYEMEFALEVEAHKRELEESAWYRCFYETDYSEFFAVTNQSEAEKAWERHFFPERFEEYRPYRFSSLDWDYMDDYGYYNRFYDRDEDLLDDDRHCDEHDDFDDGPTAAEWEEIDRLAIEKILEEEADRFSPSFGGSRRSTLRYHAADSKQLRKYGKSTSFLYRNSRPSPYAARQ